jgi:hypothetical protein
MVQAATLAPGWSCAEAKAKSSERGFPGYDGQLHDAAPWAKKDVSIGGSSDEVGCSEAPLDSIGAKTWRQLWNNA